GESSKFNAIGPRFEPIAGIPFCLVFSQQHTLASRATTRQTWLCNVGYSASLRALLATFPDPLRTHAAANGPVADRVSQSPLGRRQFRFPHESSQVVQYHYRFEY